MYTRYAEQRRWRVELMDSSLTELGGVKEAVLLIEGKGVYSRFKHESGVHRVQRVPATEGSGRIHTSTVTVAVMASHGADRAAADWAGPHLAANHSHGLSGSND